MCWSCLGDNHQHSHPLHIKTPFLVLHDSRHAVYLHNPQTRVCPLCVGALGSLSLTLDIVMCLRNPQTGVCPLLAEVPYGLQPSALLSVASQESSLSPI